MAPLVEEGLKKTTIINDDDSRHISRSVPQLFPCLSVNTPLIQKQTLQNFELALDGNMRFQLELMIKLSDLVDTDM